MLVMILLTALPISLLGYLSYDISRNTIIANHYASYTDNLQNSVEVGELLFKKIIHIHRTILDNAELREELRESNRRDDGISYFSIDSSKLFNRVLAGIYSYIGEEDVESICLFDLHERSYCLGLPSDVSQYYFFDAQDIYGSEWYPQVAERKGLEKFFSFNVLNRNQSRNSFSSVKLLRDPESPGMSHIGLLVINIRKNMFNKVFASKVEQGNYLVVENGNHPVIVYSKQDGTSMRNVVAEDGEDNRELITIRVVNKTTGWEFIHEISRSRLLRDASHIGSLTFLFTLVMCFISIGLAFMLSGMITRPLLRLRKLMTEVSMGGRNLDAKFSDDEIGVIGQQFKTMIKENIDLNERLMEMEIRKKEAELKALQAQIKPHFLYNTLNSIYWMAATKQYEHIARITVSLSESFKLSLNKGREIILVDQELKHIEHYLVIQNIRYNNKFDYVQQVDPRLLNRRFQKLLLQPFVENAIFHGLELKMGKGVIRLSGWVEGDTMVFEIADDGVGMDLSRKQGEGYGIHNVRERIRLGYGDIYGVTIISKPGEGTTVRVVLPLNEPDKEETG